jgi:hypothetical protein
MNDVLIITAIGKDPNLDSRYDKNNHWLISDKKEYDTMAFIYNDYKAENLNLDFLFRAKGQKWNLLKQLYKNIDISKYKYIGYIDDDYISDVWNLNRALEIAKKFNFKIFQCSLTHDSDLSYPILFQDKECSFSQTSFIECAAPIFRKDAFDLLIKLIDSYDIHTGWGTDIIYSDLFEYFPYVIHESSFYHPKKNQKLKSYEDDFASKECSFLLNEHYEKFCKNFLNKVPIIHNQCYTIRKFKL